MEEKSVRDDLIDALMEYGAPAGGAVGALAGFGGGAYIRRRIPAKARLYPKEEWGHFKEYITGPDARNIKRYYQDAIARGDANQAKIMRKYEEAKALLARMEGDGLRGPEVDAARQNLHQLKQLVDIDAGGSMIGPDDIAQIDRDLLRSRLMQTKATVGGGALGAGAGYGVTPKE